jgi:hypothetical protein
MIALPLVVVRVVRRVVVNGVSTQPHRKSMRALFVTRGFDYTESVNNDTTDVSVINVTVSTVVTMDENSLIVTVKDSNGTTLVSVTREMCHG